MARNLVIVESPAKARTINRYLGKDYDVKSSVGHVRDLPTGSRKTDAVDRAKEAAKTRKLSPEKRAEYKRKRAREQLVRRMGVDPDNDWKARYEVLPGKDKVVADLAKLAANADLIYLATDRDREGEAIAWHLREVLGGDDSRFRRVVFNEITKAAIEEAFEAPGSIDQNRVDAQQARRFLDRVVGFELSPLLWSKVARGLSAGRVQSVAVRLIVDREREIRAFVPEEYWEITADLQRGSDGGGARFRVVTERGEEFRPTNGDDARTAVAKLREATFTVAEREDKPTNTRPAAPFITSTLQQTASTRLGFGVRKTMTMAQRLYEAGHITYMRTDSTNISAEAIAAVREHIPEAYGDKYLPAKANVYSSKASAQEAHEAIRPTRLETMPSDLGSIEDDARRLYDLIWRRFVASQMTRAEYLSTTVTVRADDFELRVRGRVLQFDGHTRVLPPASSGEADQELPAFEPGETLTLAEAREEEGDNPHAVQHFTKPPSRYGEASLVRELESRGIGRPSTYAAIISTIQERGYVTLKNRRFYAEKIGEVVTDRLLENFANLLDYSFTADMERDLDEIADGQRAWRELLNAFYKDFSGKLVTAQGKDGEHSMRGNDPVTTDFPCPKCERPMQVRTGGTGVFLGCSGYSLPTKERCTNTLNLIPGDEAVDADQDDEAESKLLRSKRKCELCGTPMDSYLVDQGHKLHVCGNMPDCPGTAIEQGEFRIKGYEGPVIECDKCGADMQLLSGRFGKYFGCTSEDCKNTRKLLRNGQPAPPKADPVPMPELRCEKVDDHYVLRDGAAGIFLAASEFPKHRETRSPTIIELKAHANELDPKFAYLLAAPETDAEGNPAIVRYSRKAGEQFLITEKNGKPTGWRANYRNGAWQVAEAPPPKRRATKSKVAAKTRKSSTARSKAASGGN